jgi:hypothetical protein
MNTDTCGCQAALNSTAVTPNPFSAWDLVEEAAHAPAHRCACDAAAYYSAIAGTSVTRTSILRFAELLSRHADAPEERIWTVETAGPERLVVGGRRRRFQLVQGWCACTDRLCDHPLCPEVPDQYRTLCDAHMEAGGREAVREQTRLFAADFREDRDVLHVIGASSVKQLMQAAVSAGVPAAEHAKYFAEWLHLADPDLGDPWQYEDHEAEINEDYDRLLSYVPSEPTAVPISPEAAVPSQTGTQDLLPAESNGT